MKVEVNNVLEVLGDVVRLSHESPPLAVNEFWEEVGSLLGLTEPTKVEPPGKTPPRAEALLIRPKKVKI